MYWLTREFHDEFHLKTRYRTHRFAIRAISVFPVVKFNVEFPRLLTNEFNSNLPIESIKKQAKEEQSDYKHRYCTLSILPVNNIKLFVFFLFFPGLHVL
jgi:hypothetical protein